METDTEPRLSPFKTWGHFFLNKEPSISVCTSFVQTAVFIPCVVKRAHNTSIDFVKISGINLLNSVSMSLYQWNLRTLSM